VIPARRSGRILIRPAGPARCQLARRDGGMVTAEFAVALPSLALVVAASIAGLTAITDRMRCADAAGLAARLAARGEPYGEVRQLALRAAPRGAQLRLETSGDTVIATVTARLAAPGLLRRLPEFVTHEQVVAAREPGVSIEP
jgi:Flp pilus assembly protein TadG